MNKRTVLVACGFLVSAVGCNYVGPLTGGYGSYPGGDVVSSPGRGGPLGPQPSFGETVQALSPPPPMSGGTLTVVDQDIAVASDPDRDRLYVVDLRQKTSLADIPLQEHDEPGRIVEDADHRVHVVLRGGNAILTLQAPWETSVRRSVCNAPRGLAYRAASNELVVACATGELMLLPTSGGGATRTINIDDDLRDVVILGDKILVSRLRNAEVITFDGALNEIDRTSPPRFQRLGWGYQATGGMRMVAASGGNAAFLLHQRAFEDEVLGRSASAEYYGGPDPCADPIVHSALTVVAPGEEPAEAPVLSQTIVPVDIAVSKVDGRVAVAAPGNAFIAEQPTVFVVHRPAGQFLVRDEAPPPETPTTACEYSSSDAVAGQATAVAFDSQGELYVQTREPAELRRVVGGSTELVISLSSESKKDTGYDLFYSNAGGNIACASCHVEGADDGHVWRFDVGSRRTQSLRGGLAGTEPFHWGGDQKDFAALAEFVFVGRMAGPKLTDSQAKATKGWIDSIPAAPSRPVLDEASVIRGKDIFDNKAQCASCHSGDALTNNVTVDVGTGGAFQVPTLRGVSWRSPFLHDGSATSLYARFATVGGGDKHGKTSKLSSVEVQDLIAYLETL